MGAFLLGQGGKRQEPKPASTARPARRRSQSAGAALKFEGGGWKEEAGADDGTDDELEGDAKGVSDGMPNLLNGDGATARGQRRATLAGGAPTAL